jgi:HD-GYP domain-containing protein (c-di-GMP phosphodiesterase class II)
MVHDIGKIAVPSEILTKPSRLSEFEEKLLQEHPENGYQLLRDVEFPWPIAEMVRQHHERIDGSGYPMGLEGDQILPEAKVLAVADTIEAMAAARPYRSALGLKAALMEIKQQRAIKFDANVVDTALGLFEGRESIEEVIQWSGK